MKFRCVYRPGEDVPMIKEIQEKKRPHVGIGVIVVKEGKVLLGKRKNGHGIGNWVFPGSHLEHVENIGDCALRGLFEETKIKGISLHLGPWTHDIIEDTHYVTLFVFVDLFQEESHQGDAWKWFDWNDLPSPLSPPIKSLILTMGIDKLKQIACFSFSTLQNAIYPFPEKNSHPLFIKLRANRVE